MITDPRRIAVAFAGACAFLNLYTVQALLPFMAQEFGIGAAEASIILTAGTAAVALTAPFAGARITSYNVCYTKLLRFPITAVIRSRASSWFNSCSRSSSTPSST